MNSMRHLSRYPNHKDTLRKENILTTISPKQMPPFCSPCGRFLGSRNFECNLGGLVSSHPHAGGGWLRCYQPMDTGTTWSILGDIVFFGLRWANFRFSQYEVSQIEGLEYWISALMPDPFITIQTVGNQGNG